MAEPAPSLLESPVWPDGSGPVRPGQRFSVAGVGFTCLVTEVVLLADDRGEPFHRVWFVPSHTWPEASGGRQRHENADYRTFSPPPLPGAPVATGWTPWRPPTEIVHALPAHVAEAAGDWLARRWAEHLDDRLVGNAVPDELRNMITDLIDSTVSALDRDASPESLCTLPHYAAEDQ